MIVQILLRDTLVIQTQYQGCELLFFDVFRYDRYRHRAGCVDAAFVHRRGTVAVVGSGLHALPALGRPDSITFNCVIYYYIYIHTTIILTLAERFPADIRIKNRCWTYQRQLI